MKQKILLFLVAAVISLNINAQGIEKMGNS